MEKQRLETTIGVRLRSIQGTHDGIPLQRRSTSVEHEDGLDPVEEEFADPTEEAQDVCVNQGAAFLITHGGLKLVDPDAGVYGERFALHGFQPFSVSQYLRSLEKERETAQYWPT
jgi:hypothetical protein